VSIDRAASLDVPRATALDLLRRMILVRRFEEACAEAYGKQKIRGFLHLGIGEEACAVGTMAALSSDDPVVATYREHGHALMRGIPAAAVMAEMFGKANGCARGRGGSMHMFSAERGFYGGHAIVGGGLPVAVGLALAHATRKTGAIVACYFGDGATDEGEYHEALNLASLWRLPLLFLCENNLYAMGTALARHAAEVDLTRIPLAHRVPSSTVDAMDVLATLRATQMAAAEVRAGAGPRFLELRTYRFRAHSMYDAERYRTKEEVAEHKKRDPIALFSVALREAGMLDDDALAAIEASVADEVAGALRAAEEGPLEPVSDLARDVYGRRAP